jgi:hypothetical protein
MINSLGDFLAWLGGADKAILAKVPMERVRFVGMAVTLLTTAGIAVASMIFALHDAVNVPLLPSVFLGLLWGIVILNLDRFLVVSMGSTRDRGRLASIVIPRLLLALLLSTVIATPIVLRIFASDINAQLLTMQHDGFNKADTGILAQLQALSDLRAHSASSEAAWLVLLVLFIIIGILPVAVKLLINLGPLTVYEKVAKSEEEILIDRIRLERITRRRNAERESEARINIEDDLRKKEEDLGKQANEYVAREMAKILDAALQEWSNQVRARLNTGGAAGTEGQPAKSAPHTSAEGPPAKSAPPATNVRVDEGYLMPDEDNLL